MSDYTGRHRPPTRAERRALERRSRLPKSFSPAYALPTAAAATLVLTAAGATAAQSTPFTEEAVSQANAAFITPAADREAGDLLADPQLGESARTEVAASAQEHAETQAYQIPGPLRIDLTCEEELETGVFRVRPSTDKNPPARHHADVEDEPGNDDAFAGIWDEQPEASADDPNDPYVEDHGERYEDDAYDEPAPIMSAKDRPWLEIDGDRYPLLGPTVVLGRDESADIILDDGSISRRHCEVRVTHDGPRLVTHVRDLRSTNGTFVNGRRVEQTHLHEGDRIGIGASTFEVRDGWLVSV